MKFGLGGLLQSRVNTFPSTLHYDGAEPALKPLTRETKTNEFVNIKRRAPLEARFTDRVSMVWSNIVKHTKLIAFLHRLRKLVCHLQVL